MGRARRRVPNSRRRSLETDSVSFASALYTGTVMHRRLRPRRHKLSYGVFSLLLDLDELPALHQRLRCFSHNRFNIVSFHDRDHGPGKSAPLRSWVEGRLAQVGIDLDGGSIRLLCYPRILGYVFNPLSVYFCCRRGAPEVPAAIIYEVNNTFGERHCYVLPVTGNDGGILRQRCRKELYVSPFIPMEMTYDFRVHPPAAMVSVAIHTRDAEGALLYASFSGDRQPLAAPGLLRAVARFPLLTLKVIAAIHWEALKLWSKRVALVPRPKPAQPSAKDARRAAANA
jgi:DUF1365 family protein